MAYSHPPKEPIAIIGSGCRFPGDSTTPSTLWNLLRSPYDLSKPVPSESRFNADGFYHPNGEHHGCSDVTKSYFIEEDPRLFDAGFFSIAPREAEAIDPQQRLLLETVYEAMENAGLTLQGLKGSQTSAYVGAMSADYTDTQIRDVENLSQYMITGTSRALLSNRLSYFFDWKGPSISVDTACSSSLAAVHLGVQSLRNGECTVSCVAGSNLILGPDAYLAATSLHLLSASGKSQMWDEAADGYARGEGICAFFMKTLSQALKDGDRIDVLIRETCINSDGRTKGIALPSAEAQAALMGTAYRNAGLDVLRAVDRPQYIEAHGTGTQAGDPREASAITQTFFPPDQENAERPSMLVGSIKTVIGHTEGCAGIAGLLKVLLAMRHETIPPNQHLHRLNPKVEPFYENLCIPTSTQKWPSVPSLHPLRASINGFGSGGTNCHAIMESYVPEVHDHGPWGRQEVLLGIQSPVLPAAELVCTPTLFSANSETALVAMLEKYAKYLKTTDVPIRRVSMNLNLRRSTLPVRIAFSETSRQDILEAIQKQLSKANGSPGSEIGTRSSAIEFDQNRRPRIMGVFTGQGAQWPGMGQSLMAHCAIFRETIEIMEKSLAQLPNPPAWSLREELMASPTRSRLSEAEMSLPLCAAVQVGLVRVLAKAGITFYSVVGHSGGEIGAAYAAGIISATDAVRIAYYRGIVCELAVGADGRRGAMIAVGFGFDEGIKFCSSEKMKDRLTVAASNSPKSVTLSGDEDAVMEAKEILDKEGLFNRVLKVDTAYHSPHMYHCAEPYLAALEKCDIGVGDAVETTNWVSSVFEDNRTITTEHDAKMRAIYWKDNLIQRVLFSQAVERVLDDHRGVPDIILEVGPHPALRGPTLETIRTKLGSEIPYCGVLDRKSDDISSLNNALGFVWMKLGSDCVNFRGYSSAFNEIDTHINAIPLPDLPSYPWDHKQVLWRESRLNKQLRSRADRPHELLGSRTLDDTDYEPRWRNFFKLEEMPWIRDHCIQNQVILPAATYCVMALEAARALGRGKRVQSIELSNIAILRPVIINEASEGTETLLSLRSDLDSSKGKVDSIRADFSLSAGAMEDGYMRTVASGEIQIFLAKEESQFSCLFPARSLEPMSGLIPVDITQFYESLGDIGLNYSGTFRGMVSAERRMDLASALVTLDDKVGRSIPVHPTWLDTCFQTFLAAFAAPCDGSLWTAFMPTTIGRMVFSPTSSLAPDAPASVIADARITEYIPGFQATLPTINGDLSIYNSTNGHLEVRVEDFTMSSFLPAMKKDDKLLYLKSTWQQDIFSGVVFESQQNLASQHELELIDACDKAIRYYLSKFAVGKSIHDIATRSPGLAGLIQEATARDTNRPTRSELISILEKFEDNIDMVLVKMIGESLLEASQGFAPVNSQAPASLVDLTARWHNEGLGFAQIDNYIVNAAKQISHKHSQLRILQIGPSSTTLIRAVCQELGHALISYVVVDESTHAIDGMKADLITSGLKVTFEYLDIEDELPLTSDVVAAGFFDLIIAHKSFKKQQAALKAIRRLLLPGGFLLMMAATGSKLRFPFFLSGAPPRANEDDGSIMSKLTNATREETHSVLLDSGFSGIDSIAFDSISEKHTFSLLVTQALDEHITFLRSPASAAAPFNTSGKLLILGGSSPDRASFVRSIQTRLSQIWSGHIITVESLADLTQEADSAEAVLSLTELDHSLLEQLTAPTFRSFQLLVEKSKTILWVTLNARSGNSYQSGTIGLGRSLQSENPHKVLQFLDLDTLEDSESLIADSLLRLIGGALMKEDGSKLSHLWTIEPEIAVEKGKFLISRILSDTERNDRLNSLRRRVETQVIVKSQPVALTRLLHPSGDIVYTAEEALHHRPKRIESSLDKDQICLRVEYCSIDCIIPNCHGNNLFCCVGIAPEGERFLAMSLSNSSVVTVPRKWTVRLDDTELENANILPLLIDVQGEVMWRVVEESMHPGFITLLYKPTANLAASFERHRSQSRRGFMFINHRSQSILDSPPIDHINIRPHSSKKDLASMIPPRTKLLIHQGLCVNTPEFSALKRALPKNIMVVSFDELEASFLEPGKILSEAWDSVMGLSASLKSELDSTSVVKASVLVAGGISSSAKATVIDWTGEQTITLTQKPIQLRHLLSAHKTYILVGLSGQIGQSVCRWMVGNGARHIVLASRNPDKKSPWRDELQCEGASIVMEAADVTDKQDLVELRTRILSSMPPIGGVANGAMVMSNGLFADMSYESFQKVLRPKVEGSKYLDEVFSNDNLDFFILFSSISGVTGQQSQANYAAANNFMVGLALERRARNLPASVVDLGMIIGIGFIQRTEADEGVGSIQSLLRKLDYMPVSERDLHHILAEAILVGTSDQSPEILTGLETHKTASCSRPFWHRNARFSHLIADSGCPQAVAKTAQKTSKEKLADARGPEEALQIMEESLLIYLASSLKLPLENIYTEVPVIDLGIDSLVAVEIRNWIFSEFGHDVPVLQILGGSSVRQICNEVTSSLVFEGKEIASIEAQPAADPSPSSRDWSKSSETTQSPDNTSNSSISSVPLLQTEYVMKKKGPRPDAFRTESLSIGQLRLFFLSQYLDDDTALNCAASYALSGQLDLPRLEKALVAVTQRHETLRTMFYTNEQDGQPVQGIFGKSTFELRKIPGLSDILDVQREFDWTYNYHYAIDIGETFIATVLSHSAHSHTVIFGYHHIIMDGISWQIFLQDLAKFYNDPTSVSTFSKSVPAQYIDFTLKQQQELSSGAFAKRLQYFRDEFREPIAPLPLFPFATVNTRKTLTKYKVRNVVTYVSADVVGALKKASQASRSTSFHFWLSAFQVLLHRLLDTEQLSIGVVDANRSDQAFSNTVGFFLETIPIQFRLQSEHRFSDVLRATRNKVYGAFAQTGVPIEEILRALNIPSSTTETALFQVAFNYRMGASQTSSMRDLDMKFLDYADAKTAFDLVVSVDEMNNGGARLTFTLQDYLYDHEGAELLANSYTHLLNVLSIDTSSSIGSISMFDPALMEQAVALGTGPQLALAPPSADTLSKMVNLWVEKDPNATAVKDISGYAKTYFQLSESASEISRVLLQAGAASSRVCVLLNPNIDTISTILGILRIGAVYVPLDVRNSDELLVDILEESGATMLLYHAATADRAKKLHSLSQRTEGIEIVALDKISPASAEKVQDVSTLDGLAMILYTSGTVGKPKGIPWTNANIRTPVLSLAKTVGLSREVLLQQSGHGFDMAILQIFITLVNGGTLIMGDNRGDPAELAALMEREGVTCTMFIVSEMQTLLKYGYDELCRCSSWRFAMLGGEAFTTTLLDQFRSLKRPDLRIINGYGPSEAAIVACMKELSTRDANINGFNYPVGRAIANYGMYIVDKNCHPVPIGWPGEIAISGPGVASGYLNLPQLTQSKFKMDHISPKAGRTPSVSDKLYLTGDRGRMLADGSIMILGRVDGDTQVKLRGRRVHLNDVSKALVEASLGNLVDATVLVRGDEAETQILIAYAVFSRASQVEEKQRYLRRLCQELPIPLYMRPVLVIPLDTLPVTERGKLDSRKLAALPLPEELFDEEVDEQLTEHEVQLQGVWRRVLSETSSSIPIRRSSDFFSVGGNSLLLLRLRSEILKEFAVDIPLAELFRISSLELLAARLTGNSKPVHIDWEKETEPDARTFESARSENTSKEFARSTEKISVLLTGATGFLGAGILRQLVDTAHVARIHCVAIRKNAQGETRQLSMDSPKIVRHSGDLALPNLGMSQELATDVFNNVDVIIHNGAEVSHVKSYRSLRAPNVLSTIELARVAVSRRIPIHYISTGGVAQLSGATSQPESSLAAFHPSVDGSDGYVASKWASEVFLEKVYQRYNGSVWIHRPSNVTGNEVPALDIMHSVLRFSEFMKAVPDLTGSTGAFDFVNIDNASKEIVNHAITSADRVKRGTLTDLVFVHESGDEIIPVDQLREHLEQLTTEMIGVLPMYEWVAGAVKMGLDEIVGSYLLASGGVVRIPLLHKAR